MRSFPCLAVRQGWQHHPWALPAYLEALCSSISPCCSQRDCDTHRSGCSFSPELPPCLHVQLCTYPRSAASAFHPCHPARDCTGSGLVYSPLHTYNFPSPHPKLPTSSPASQAVLTHTSQEQHEICLLPCSVALQSRHFCPLGTVIGKSSFLPPKVASVGPKEVPVWACRHCLVHLRPMYQH